MLVETTGTALALAENVKLMVGQLNRRLRTESTEHGISVMQESVVWRLDRFGGMTVAELARAENVRPQSMSVTVRRLVDSGLVVGAPDPDDGRRTVLDLTEAGREALASVRANKHQWLVSVLSELDATQTAELQRSVALLIRLADH